MRHLYETKKKLIILLILIALPLISAGGEVLFGCSGGSEVIICPFSSPELSFFGRDFIKPVVTLIAPADASEDTDTIVFFRYNITDANSILNCSLLLEGITEQTDTTIARNTEQFFKVNNPPVKDNLRWYINCTDKFNNQGNSTEWGVDTSIGGGTVSGGAGGMGIIIKNVSITLCNLTYYSLLDYGKDYSRIKYIQEDYEELTNETADYLKTKNYMDYWQPTCSYPILNRSLEPDTVCEGIYNVVIDTDFRYGLEDAIGLRDSLKEIVEVHIELMRLYFEKYNDLCYREGYTPELKGILPITGAVIGGVSGLSWFIIIFMFLGIFGVIVYNKRKKVIAVWKKFKSSN